MFIGVDVGGTNIDAVLLRQDRTCLKAIKEPTEQSNLVASLLRAIEKLIEGHDPASVKRLCISSTIGLNALLTNKTTKTGIILLPGPGVMLPQQWFAGGMFVAVKGSQDHRGIITTLPDEKELQTVAQRLIEQGAEAFGVVAKFSPKNPALEKNVAEVLLNIIKDSPRFAGRAEAIPVLLGSSCGGELSFHRRVNTTYFNASLYGLGKEVAAAFDAVLPKIGLSCDIAVLKSDAGAYSGDAATQNPMGSIVSGPAASMLGVMALGDCHDDLLVLDIGGTTVDVSFLVGGEPLLAKEGLRILGRPTLVRALKTRSIAVGGDSSLVFEGGTLQVAPQRLGPAIACCPDDCGKRPPTLSDALNIVGGKTYGDVSASYRAMEKLFDEYNKSRQQSVASQPQPEPLSGGAGKGASKKNKHKGVGGTVGATFSPAVYLTLEDFARGFIYEALRLMHQAVDTFIAEINSQPVYTINELLHEKTIAAERIVLIGGPAWALRDFVAKEFSCPVTVPEYATCANAIGAALAKPTNAAILYADTKLGAMHIPSLGVHKKIPSSYSLEEAKENLAAALLENMEKAFSQGGSALCPEKRELADVQYVFGETFHSLDTSGKRSKVIMVMAQFASGLL